MNVQRDNLLLKQPQCLLLESAESIALHKINSVFHYSLSIAKSEKEHLVLSPLHLDLQEALKRESRCLRQILPPLQGPYQVAYSNLVIERPEHSVLGDSKIGIEVFFPTSTVSNEKTSLDPKSYPSGHMLSENETLQTHSLKQNSAVALQEKLPLILFSHGLGCEPQDYRVLLEEIASHGYIILSLNHPSSSAYAPFAQKTFDPEELSAVENLDQELEHLATIQTQNINHVLQKMKQADFQKTFPFIALDRPILLCGHSLGGSSSVMAAKTNADVTGCINLDGALRGEKATEALQQPVLTLTSETPSDPSLNQTIKDWKIFHQNSPLSQKEKIDHTTHMDFALTGAMLLWLVGEMLPSSASDRIVGVDRALKTHYIASQKILEFVKPLTETKC